MQLTAELGEPIDGTCAVPSHVGAPIAGSLAEFTTRLRYEDVPQEVRDRAKLLILDCVGIALASGTYDFAKRAEAAAQRLAGSCTGVTVIGREAQLPLRDAVMLNGVLVHGLDYDDTHPAGIVHASASAFPAALGIAEEQALSGPQLVLGYLIGVEVATRLGMAANGGLHQAGFHPTGVVGAFGVATLASRLYGLSAPAAAAAQGFVGSLAAGSLEFVQTGAWTKRVHPGWAGVCGITAAAYAAEGFETPPEIYEGRFGFYRTHVGGQAKVALDKCVADLGEVWETMAVAVKPFPACHFAHAFADAAMMIREQHDVRPADVESVHCLIAEGEVDAVFEPLERKRAPRSPYDAQFSVPYVVAATFQRNQFTLAELDVAAINDPDILALAQRVTYEVDPSSGFPDLFSGEVRVRTFDGREFSHREQVNRGAGTRPLSEAEIVEKFQANANCVLPPERTETILNSTMGLDGFENVRDFARILGGEAGTADSSGVSSERLIRAASG